MQEPTPCTPREVGAFRYGGGLDSCPWMQDYGDSPGLPRDWLAEKVLEIGQLIQAIGWEATIALGPHLECSRYEADLVRHGLLWVLSQEMSRPQAQGKTRKGMRS